MSLLARVTSTVRAKKAAVLVRFLSTSAAKAFSLLNSASRFSSGMTNSFSFSLIWPINTNPR
jgi:hypothetical protein